MAKRVALLIGNQTFRSESGLPPLRGPQNDVAALSRVLSDSNRGQFEVRTFFDRAHHEIFPEIERTLRSTAPGDLVLIYYSGHGKLDKDGRLYLATADTEEEALHSTSIAARHLTGLVNDTDCDQVILLLDCCYSGAVDEGVRGALGDEMHNIEDALGFFILTASTKMQTAREEEPSQGVGVMGRFTSAIVNGIETGAADIHHRERVLLSDLRQHLEKTVKGQTPTFYARKASGDPFISFNPARIKPQVHWTPPPAPPKPVISQPRSPQPPQPNPTPQPLPSPNAKDDLTRLRKFLFGNHFAQFDPRTVVILALAIGIVILLFAHQ